MKVMSEQIDFEEQFNKTIQELDKLVELWEEDKITNYPKYLPSFDEFVLDFSQMCADRPKDEELIKKIVEENIDNIEDEITYQLQQLLKEIGIEHDTDDDRYLKAIEYARKVWRG